MKRILFLCYFLLTGFASFAETSHETTTDHFEISSLTLNPGVSTSDNDYITFSLEGSQKYCAFGADLYLPAGYEWAKDSYGETAYLSTDGTMFTVGRGGAISSHTIGYEVQNDGALRVTISSLSNAEFKATSGALFDVFVKATTYAKPGAADVQIKNCFFTTAEGVQYDATDETISDKVAASSSATASVSLSGTTKWSTLILPFDASLPDGVKAYTCSEKDDAQSVLKLQPASSIAAYTPYIMYTESDYSGNLTGTVDASSYPENGYVTSGYLNGAIAKQSIDTGYVLQNLNNVVQFYNCDGDTFTIPAGKCWVTIPAGNAAKGYGFTIDETSGIEDVNADVNLNANIYNIAGQRVNSDTKGIIIINGKKVLK